MKTVDLYLFETTPETITVLSLYIRKLKDLKFYVRIHVYNYCKGDPSWCLGWLTLNNVEFLYYINADALMTEYISDYDNNYACIGISNLENKDIPGDIISSGVKSGYVFRPSKNIHLEELEAKFELSLTYLKRKDSKTEITKIKHVSNNSLLSRYDNTPKLVVICSRGFEMSHEGTGMGTHINDLGRNLKRLAQLYGYNLILASESQIGRIEFNSKDRVTGLSVNGAYQGRSTVIGQGIEIKHLIELVARTKHLEVKPIIGCSLHSSEFQTYNKLEQDTLDKLKTLQFSACHELGNECLRNKGLNVHSKTFPIPIKLEANLETTRMVGNHKIVLLQIDTQTRKNGEYSLSILIDAFNQAKITNPDITIDVICKSSATHSYPNVTFLKQFIENMGLTYPSPIDGMTLKFEGITSDSMWKDTKKSIDIFMALSLEEGAYLFVPEIWMTGAHVVIISPGACSTYKELNCNVTEVKGIKINNIGSGAYNDTFLGSVYFPDYNDSVIKLSKLLENDINIKPRNKINTIRMLDHDGTHIGKMLKLEDHNRESITVTKLSSGYLGV